VRVVFDDEVVAWTPDNKSVVTKVVPEGRTIAEANKLGWLGRPAINGTDSASKVGSVALTGATVRVFTGGTSSKDQSKVDTNATRTSPDPSNPDPVDLDAVVERSATADLGLVSIASGGVRRIARGVYTWAWWISPDGNNVAYMNEAARHRRILQQYLALTVVSVTGGAPRVLVPRIPQWRGQAASWSPDGRRLAYTTFAPSGWSGKPNGDAYVVSADGGTPLHLTRGVHPFLGWDTRPPLWTPQGDALVLLGGGRLWRAALSDTLAVALTPASWEREAVRLVAGTDGRTVWSPDGGRSAIVSTRDSATVRAGFARVDLTSGGVTQLVEEDRAYGSNMPTPTPDERRLAYVAEDARHGPDVWLLDSSFREPRQLTHVNAHLERYKLGMTRIIKYQSRRGELLRGLLVVPPDYSPDRRVPLVVIVYPAAVATTSGK
jgi:dipeptidyl aminopeptidase/acylaminoacyl peptidase